MRHDRVRRRQDVLRRPVVLLKQDDPGAGEVTLEFGDVAYGRAAERVDRLVSVADHAELARRHEVVTPQMARPAADKLPDQHVLRVVGVLVLIDQDVPELAPPVGGHVRKCLEQVDGDHDDVVEVHRACGDQPALILAVGLGERLLPVPVGSRRDGLVVEQIVLERRHPAGHGLRRVVLGVQVELAADQAHQPLGVRLIVDRERGRVPEPRRLPAQDPDAGRVECQQPHAASLRAGQRVRAGGHLARRLVRERDREYLRRRHVALCHQVGDPVGQHAGLARPRAGDDQQRAALVQHGSALLRVEPVK